MPAAAVIPAPIAYTKVVAVKKLVVGFLLVGPESFSQESRTLVSASSSRRPRLVLICRACVCLVFYCEQTRVFKAGLRR